MYTTDLLTLFPGLKRRRNGVAYSLSNNSQEKYSVLALGTPLTILHATQACRKYIIMLRKIQGFIPHWEQFLRLCEDQPIPATLLMKIYTIEGEEPTSSSRCYFLTFQQLQGFLQDSLLLEGGNILQALSYLEKRDFIKQVQVPIEGYPSYWLDPHLLKSPLRACYQAQQLEEAFNISHPHARGLFPDIYRSESARLSNHRSRARKMGRPTTLTIEQWIETLAHFDLYCAYCRRLPYMAFEHFIPLTRGGGTTWDNCIPACCKCNGDKSYLYPGQYQENTGEENLLDRIVEYLHSRSEVGRQIA